MDDNSNSMELAPIDALYNSFLKANQEGDDVECLSIVKEALSKGLDWEEFKWETYSTELKNRFDFSRLESEDLWKRCQDIQNNNPIPPVRYNDPKLTKLPTMEHIFQFLSENFFWFVVLTVLGRTESALNFYNFMYGQELVSYLIINISDEEIHKFNESFIHNSDKSGSALDTFKWDYYMFAHKGTIPTFAGMEPADEYVRMLTKQISSKRKK